jgi:hypothetical protein
MRVNIASVKPTVAIASAPRCETQKMSTTTNNDSMLISRIMGTASNRMARWMGTWVKS